jgi:hypothetical protein
MIDTGIDTAAEAAIAALILVYALAAWFNTAHPATGVEMRPLRQPRNAAPGRTLALLPDFWRLQQPPVARQAGADLAGHHHPVLGRGGNLRYIVLAWAAAALGYNTTQASAWWAWWPSAPPWAPWWRPCACAGHGHQRDPAGHRDGAAADPDELHHNIWLAIPFLILLGGLGGFLVVPMNALLQHRGHNLMGAGRSIAVQNFNEQACILGLGAFYSRLTKFGLSAFGPSPPSAGGGRHMELRRWHQRNCVQPATR